MQTEIKTFWNLYIMKLNKNIQTKSIQFQRESSTDEMRWRWKKMNGLKSILFNFGPNHKFVWGRIILVK